MLAFAVIIWFKTGRGIGLGKFFDDLSDFNAGEVGLDDKCADGGASGHSKSQGKKSVAGGEHAICLR
jgi:hypothetical protein